MIKNATVKQKHLYSGEKNLMYKGEVEYILKDSCTTLIYKEYDKKTEVKIIAHDDVLDIYRKGEVESHLHYIPNVRSKGTIMTEFGMIEIEIFTHKYIKKENIIAIEYDIVQNDDVIDGYRIIWNIKGGSIHESN